MSVLPVSYPVPRNDWKVKEKLGLFRPSFSLVDQFENNAVALSAVEVSIKIRSGAEYPCPLRLKVFYITIDIIDVVAEVM